MYDFRKLVKKSKHIICRRNDANKMIEMGFVSVPMFQVGDQIMNMKEAMAWIKEYNNMED